MPAQTTGTAASVSSICRYHLRIWKALKLGVLVMVMSVVQGFEFDRVAGRVVLVQHAFAFFVVVHQFMEELEAVDWYNQRVATCTDAELKKLLAHNRDEEMEHACMALEWLRRNMPGWDHMLRTYLFQDESVSIVDTEKHATNKADTVDTSNNSNSAANGNASLGIGSLKS